MIKSEFFNMLVLLFKQPLNRWRQLGRWQQFQLLILGFIVFAYLATELHNWFAGLPVGSMMLGLLTAQGFLLLSVLSAPFIFKYALPRNKALYVFHTLPLSRSQSVQLLAWFYHIYQIPLLLLLLTAVSALFLLNPLAGVSALALSVLYDFLVLASAGLIYFRKSGGDRIHFEKIYPPNAGTIQKDSVRNSAFQKSGGLRLLIKKELLGLWRNPHYRRLKIITWIFYMAGLKRALFFRHSR